MTDLKHTLLTQVIKSVPDHAFFDTLKCHENAPFSVQLNKSLREPLLSILFSPSYASGYCTTRTITNSDHDKLGQLQTRIITNSDH